MENKTFIIGALVLVLSAVAFVALGETSIATDVEAKEMHCSPYSCSAGDCYNRSPEHQCGCDQNNNCVDEG